MSWKRKRTRSADLLAKSSDGLISDSDSDEEGSEVAIGECVSDVSSESGDDAPTVSKLGTNKTSPAAPAPPAIFSRNSSPSLPSDLLFIASFVGQHTNQNQSTPERERQHKGRDSLLTPSAIPGALPPRATTPGAGSSSAISDDSHSYMRAGQGGRRESDRGSTGLSSSDDEHSTDSGAGGPSGTERDSRASGRRESSASDSDDDEESDRISGCEMTLGMDADAEDNSGDDGEFGPPVLERLRTRNEMQEEVDMSLCGGRT